VTRLLTTIAASLEASNRRAKCFLRVPAVSGGRGTIFRVHEILKALQKKIGEHSEMGAAIAKLEMALNDLAMVCDAKGPVVTRVVYVPVPVRFDVCGLLLALSLTFNCPI